MVGEKKQGIRTTLFGSGVVVERKRSGRRGKASKQKRKEKRRVLVAAREEEARQGHVRDDCPSQAPAGADSAWPWGHSNNYYRPDIAKERNDDQEAANAEAGTETDEFQQEYDDEYDEGPDALHDPLAEQVSVELSGLRAELTAWGLPRAEIFSDQHIVLISLMVHKWNRTQSDR